MGSNSSKLEGNQSKFQKLQESWRPDVHFSVGPSQTSKTSKTPNINDNQNLKDASNNSLSEIDKNSLQSINKSDKVIQTVRVRKTLFTHPLEQQQRIHEEIDAYREELRDAYDKCTHDNLSAFYSIVGLFIGTSITYATKLKLPFILCPAIGASIDFYYLFDKCIPFRNRVDKLNIVVRKMELLLEKESLRKEIDQLSKEFDDDTLDLNHIPVVTDKNKKSEVV